MSLTPPQRHALRTICRLGSVQPDAVRHAMKEPVRCIIAKGLAHHTEQGIEPTDDGWAMGARMRPPIIRPQPEPAPEAPDAGSPERCCDCETRHSSDEDFVYRGFHFCINCMSGLISWFLDGGTVAEPDQYDWMGIDLLPPS
jgi:hypothetical protein